MRERLAALGSVGVFAARLVAALAPRRGGGTRRQRRKAVRARTRAASTPSTGTQAPIRLPSMGEWTTTLPAAGAGRPKDAKIAATSDESTG